MEAKLDTKKLTCICCPLGCSIEADMQGGSVVVVRGNGCPNGEKYAHTELTAPVRTLTSTVALANSKSGVITLYLVDGVIELAFIQTGEGEVRPL